MSNPTLREGFLLGLAVAVAGGELAAKAMAAPARRTFGRLGDTLSGQLNRLSKTSGLSRSALLAEAGYASKDQLNDIRARLDSLDERLDALLRQDGSPSPSTKDTE